MSRVTSAHGFVADTTSGSRRRTTFQARRAMSPERLASRQRDAMAANLLDPLVTAYEPLIAGLTAINGSDRHVLAAAIQGQCSVIVTENLKHLPLKGLGAL